MNELALAVFASETGTHLVEPPHNRRWDEHLRAFDSRAYEAQLGARGFRFVPRPKLPVLLRVIHDPPPGLFVRGEGELRLLESASVAVVGARACSGYGAAVARSVARELAAAGLVVISGLARGIDAEAHRGALDAGAPTVAVLGCGIDRDYPAAHAELARRIAATGLIVSEYAPGVDPAPWRFPASNRQRQVSFLPHWRARLGGQMKIPFHGYGRVSREDKKRRNDPGYHSPEEQEAGIRRKVAELGAEVGRIAIETNVSGGKAATDRVLEELVASCERGEAQGIVVLNFKRFSREHPLHVMGTLNRLHAVGARLVSVHEGLDTSQPGAAMYAMGLAEGAYAEHQSMKERAHYARRSKVARGVHASKNPFGYARGEDSRLVPDPATAPIVRELFERRAAGASISELERWLIDLGHKKARSTINGMLANETYLGHVTNGDAEHRDAHEPIIDVELFDTCRAMKGQRPVHTDALASQAMLRSVLRCGSCGTTMCVTWTNGAGKDKNGKRNRVPAYDCNNRATCTAKAYIRASVIDTFVDEWVVATFERRDSSAEAYQAQERLNQTAADLARGEADYARLKKNWVKLSEKIGEDDANEMLADAKGKVELLRIAHGRALKESQKIEGFNGSMRDAWPTLSLASKRSILLDWFDHITVTPDKNRKLAVRDRVTIVIDGTLAEFATSPVAA